MTLGDLSVSQIAVLNLPIELADVCNPEPFLEPSSTETYRSRPNPRRIWSSRGRIHNAIENGNEFVVRTVLAMGMDVEELDSSGRTPLVRATMKRQEAICKLLVGKGASLGALKAFTNGMDADERSKLLDPLIGEAIDDGSKSVTVLRLLVQMALGTNYGADNRSSSQPMNVAIDLGYGLVVRAIIHLEPQVLVDADTEGQTPLVYAVVKHQKAICKLLLEKGSSLEELKAFTGGMDLKERSVILDPLIREAIDNAYGWISVTALRLLVQMALGTNYGGVSQSMNIAIDMSYGLVVRAIIHLEPQVLVEVNTEGRTPFSYAYYLRRNDICQILLEYSTLTEAAKDVAGMKLGTRLVDDAHDAIVVDCPKFLELVLAVDASIEKLYTEKYGQTFFVVAFSLHRPKICEMLLNSTRQKINTAAEDLKLEGDLAEHFRFAIEKYCPRVLDLLLATGVDVEKIHIEGQTLLAHAAEAVLNSEDNNHESLNYICKALLNKASRANIENVRKVRPKLGARQWIATSMHELVKKEYKSLLVLLSLMESRGAEGLTPLASTAFTLNEALCEFLVEKGYSLFLDTEDKEQLKSKLSCRIHDAAKRGRKTALQLLLDMGADINERNSDGETALLEAVHYNHLSCVKLLIERGADPTIESTIGGASVLHRAAYRSTDSEIMMFLLEDVVETGKLVDMKHSRGNTALHDCSLHDNQSSVVRLENAKLLLQAGASLTIKNNNGNTPYECARDRERQILAKYLWSQLSPEQQAREKPPPSDW